MKLLAFQFLTTIVAAVNATSDVPKASGGGIPATASAGGIPAFASAGDIPEFMADSLRGTDLLTKSRRTNQQYEEDLSWMTKYSIKYGSCHSMHAYGGEAGGGGDEEDGSMFGVQHLIKYHLCPTTSSGGCNNCGSGGTYVVELRDFVEAYVEIQAELEATACENVEANCNCNYYNDDDVCLAKCYETAGLSNCQNDNGNDFDVSEYMECKEAEFGNNNNGNGNYYNSAFYIGPVCTKKGVFLKLFSDASCTTAAPKGTYEKYNYNYALPYSKKSIVDTTCISCKETQDNNNDGNNNNNGNDDANANYYEQEEAIEMCQEMYEQSAKCEKNLKAKDSTYRDTGSCAYINKVLPALEKVYHRNGGGVATGMAVFFALTTVATSAAAYYFYTKVERTTVGLATKDESVFA
jgi:hypothetical protein